MGMKEEQKIEKVQNRYLKWIFGLNASTSTYIVQEEPKRNTVTLEAGKRAVKYELEIKQNRRRKIRHECWKQINSKKKRSHKNKWEVQKKFIANEEGHSIICRGNNSTKLRHTDTTKKR